MLEDVDVPPWSSLAQPKGNAPSTVPDALRRIATAASPAEATEAHHRFINSVGNSHRGTYFPVVLHTLPFLEEILRGARAEAVRNATLDALIELAGSFEPDPDFQTIAADSGEPKPLRALLHERMLSLTEATRTLALDMSAEHMTRKLACDLLELIESPRR